MQKRASQRKHHIVYRTTCVITGRFYIGLHSTDDLNDGYVGSGQRLWRSIKKHGKENHVCEILEHFMTREAAAEREKELIQKFWKVNSLCLNLGPGGLGYTDRPPTRDETRAKLSKSLIGKKRTDETRARMSAAARKTQMLPEVRAKKSASQKERLAEPGQREKMSEVQRKLGMLPHIREQRAALKRKPCTIDGITIFSSKGDLIAALGSGKGGGRSPNLRFIEINKSPVN